MPVPVRGCVAALPTYRPGRPAPASAGVLLQAVQQREPLPAAARSARRDRTSGGADEPLPGHGQRGDDGRAELSGSASALTSWPSAPDRSAVLYHLLQAVCEPGDEVVYAWRSFEAYPIAVQLTGATPVPVPLGPGPPTTSTAMLAAVTPATRAVLLCTPNNPTGPALGHEAVRRFVAAVPARGDGGGRRGLRRVRHRPRGRPRPRAAGRPRQRGGAADVLQGVRAGRLPGRLLRRRPRAGRGGPGGVAALRRLDRRPGRRRRLAGGRAGPARAGADPGGRPGRDRHRAARAGPRGAGRPRQLRLAARRPPTRRTPSTSPPAG